jgi:tRNA (mo5U34)-methyltransferase
MAERRLNTTRFAVTGTGLEDGEELMEPSMSTEELRRAINPITWYHRIDLGGGVVTGGYDVRRRLRELKLPNLAGKTVLDIGAWDGAYSFAAERLGASRVLATDHFAWGAATWTSKDGFNLARQALGSKVEDLDIDPVDLSAEQVGTFDVVLFLGVLYHLENPMQVLERVFDVTGELAVLETEVDMLWSRRAAAAVYEGSELNRDATNWWGPNPRAVIAMLRSVGFRRAVVVSRHRLPYIAGRAAYLRLKRGNRFLHGLRRDRVVFHAWR